MPDTDRCVPRTSRGSSPVECFLSCAGSLNGSADSRPPMRIRSYLGTAATLLLLAACGGDKATAPKAPTLASLSIVQKIDTLAELDSRQLSLTGLDSKGAALTPSGATWTSSDNSIATVTSLGYVTALRAGNVTISAAIGSVSTTLGLRITEAPVRDIQVKFVDALAQDTLMVGSTASIIAEARDGVGRLLSARKIAVDVGDPTRASIDAQGRVTGLTVGYLDFVAKYDTIVRRTTVVIRPTFAAKMTLRLADPKKLGDTTWAGLKDSAIVQFADDKGNALPSTPFRPVTFTTSDPNVATVDLYGHVRFTAAGTATIRASGDRLVAAKQLTAVRAPVIAIVPAPDTVRLLPGGDSQIRPILVDGGGLRASSVTGHTLTFAAVTPGIATVDAFGNVHGVAVGNGQVKVTSDRGSVLVPVKVLGPPSVAPFKITMRFVGPTPSAEVLDAFKQAQERWQGVIRETSGILQAYTLAKGTCNSTDSTHVEDIPDVLIFARIDSIDGPSNILGQAGPCIIKRMPSGRYMSSIGRMTFDSADMHLMATKNMLVNVITHEMGHVLGIGTLWSASYNNGVAMAVQGGFDPSYAGAAGMAASAGMGYTGLSLGANDVPFLDRVPLEDTGGSGTAGSHWRRSVFGDELMNGWAVPGRQALSLLTVSAMADFGYVVNTSAAETWGTYLLSGAPAANKLSRYLGIQPEQIGEQILAPEIAVERGGTAHRLRAPQ